MLLPAFLKVFILLVVITSSPVTGKEGVGPEFVTIFPYADPGQESFITAQMQLEQVANSEGLYQSPKNERQNKEKKIMQNPQIQGLARQAAQYESQPNCNNLKYRTYDGTCNNPKKPLWGSSYYMIERYLPAAYEGISGLRKSVEGGDLPHPRNISLKLVEKDEPTTKVSAFFTFFGQIIAHDVSLAPSPSKNGLPIECCSPSEENNPECKNIYISKNDPFYKKFDVTCIPFPRTAPYPTGTFGKRSQINKETSYLDLSIVYGYNESTSNSLRLKDGSGKLKFQHSSSGDLLPANKIPNLLFCPVRQTTNCFKSGDDRVNQHAMLTIMHTLFLRFHNDIADKLHSMNPSWQEEKLFQESRRINIAVYQYIVYSEYVEWIVTGADRRRKRLYVFEDSLYDDQVNPTTFAEFGTGAFRLHSMIPKTVSKKHPETRFDETYSNPQLLHKGETESLVDGSCDVPSQKNDRYLMEDIDNFLYRPPGLSYGADLTAVDVQRGRDHGLPPFVDVVRKCTEGVVDIQEFSDLKLIMPQENADLLQSIYKSVSDIDLLIGIYMETSNYYTVTGDTGSCLLSEQFQRFKFGDSFFFSHKNGRYPFTKDQLKSIRSFRLMQFICQTGAFSSIRVAPFAYPGFINFKLFCELVPKFNLEPWRGK